MSSKYQSKKQVLDLEISNLKNEMAKKDQLIAELENDIVNLQYKTYKFKGRYEGWRFSKKDKAKINKLKK